MIYTLSTESHRPGTRIGAQGLLGDTGGVRVNRGGVEGVGNGPVWVHGRVTCNWQRWEQKKKERKEKEGCTCEVDIRGGEKCKFGEMKVKSCRRKREIRDTRNKK